MIDTTLSSFERDVVEASMEVPVLVDFWAPWDAVEVAATLPPADILERRVRIDGNDLRARLELAELHIAREEYAPALDQLLENAGRDRAFEDDIGQRKMVEVFAIAADQGELVADYRAKLSAILF